jgi:3-oxoacyl-[acyl-carrier-protein] synthase II
LAYISAASTISHQPTFRNAGFSSDIQPLQEDSVLISPDYKGFIEPGLLRRMSKILRMSVSCAKDCTVQSGIDQPDAIIVGTGLGCLLDTEKFLNNSITIEGLLPPTSFIQSTHNTMAGQISLSIGNHGYNMTHTQNTLSFEHAVQDGMLLLNEGEKHILVGAADEHIEILDEISAKLNIHFRTGLTSAASFFMLSDEKSETTLAKISDVRTAGLVTDVPAQIKGFLAENQVEPAGLDLILFSGNPQEFAKIACLETDMKLLDYTSFSGVYPTSSAFALHFAVDKMQSDKSLKHILICNTLNKNNLGLILLRSVEA